jgi:O-antigen/teichoic acid export membrane protein
MNLVGRITYLSGIEYSLTIDYRKIMNIKKITGYAIGPIGSGILGFITLPAITWFYSIDDVGRVSMLQVFTSFFILLFCLGLDQAYIREYHGSENKSLLLKMSLLPGFILSLVFFLVLFLYDEKIISIWLYELSDTYLSIVTAICFIVALISRFLSLVVRMQDRAFAFSMSQLLAKVLFLVFILFTVWSGFARNTYNLITANVLSMLFTFLIFSWNTRKDWIAFFNNSIDKILLRKLLNFGLPLVIGGLAFWGLNAMSRLFLRAMSTYSELGVYSVTMSLASVVTILSSIFNTIWSPVVYKWESENSIDMRKMHSISEIVLAVIYFSIVIVGLFAWIIPFLLPHEYMMIQFLITSCLIGPLLYTLSEVTAVGISLTRKTKLSMIAAVFAMLVNLLGNYFLVPIYGAIGATASTALAFWIFFVLKTEFSKLVWHKISVRKTYIVTGVLMVYALTSMFFLRESIFIFSLIWLILFFIGLFVFKSVIKDILIQIKLKLVKA